MVEFPGGDMMPNFEYFILDFIQNLSSPFMDFLMKSVTFLGDAGWVWIAAGIILSIIPKTRKVGFTVCLSLIFSVLISNVTLKPLIARTRPYDLIEGIRLIIDAPKDFSFPSGHTSASFAAAAAIFAYNKKWGSIPLILAFLIGFSRLYLYVHFPTDVLGGAVIGSICAIISYYSIKLIYTKKVSK